MVMLKPFRAYRPRADLTAQVAALPYDVYSRSEARAQVAREPDSFLRIDRAETTLPEDVDTYDPRVYAQARSLLWKMVEEGRLVQDDREALYLYELTMDGRTQTGLVGLAGVDDYRAGIIKKHENTRADKEEDRVRHVTACHAHTGPIFLAYRSAKAIQALTEEAKQAAPVFDFTAADGVHHRGWMLADPEQVAAFTAAFHALPRAYIADGHHRAASAVRVALQKREAHPDYTGNEAFNDFLAVFFPDEELHIMDYNRVVRDLNGLTETEFLVRLGDVFRITPLEGPEKPREKGTFSMYLSDRWYALALREPPAGDDPVAALDVAVLQDRVLSPILGIQDPKTDHRIDFVGGIRGLAELERRCHTDMTVAFALYPTAIGELFSVADADRLMPPKSTWFEPKLRSGLFIHEIEDD